MYEIENGIPAPSLRGRPAKFPLLTMNVGDSFAAPIAETNDVRCAVQNLRHRSLPEHRERKFVTRRDGQFIRCWRVA